MDKENKFYKKSILWYIVLIVIISIEILLPFFAGLYSLVFSQFRVNPESLNISRLELLKIFLSLVGPVLTFLVFRNTLEIQEKNKKERDKDKKERDKDKEERDKERDSAERRTNLDDANREFYNLLDLFNKQQSLAHKSKIFEKIYGKAILSNDGYDFINDYNPVVYSQTYLVTTSYKGPTFESYENDPPKRIEIEEDIENRILNVLTKQYESVYSILGSYFEIFHRIIKNLNQRLELKILNEYDYKNLIGILRTQISPEEFVVILVNSLYIKRGIGLGVELVGTGLFGDVIDIKINQHFDSIEISKKISEKDLEAFIYNNNSFQERKLIRNKYMKEKNKGFKSFNNLKNFKSFYHNLKK